MKIVVIVPAYNEEQHLPGLLDSLIAQTRRPDEVIVVDDGSQDRTAEIVGNYESAHDFIRLVRNEHKDKRAVGAKVVQAFFAGYRVVQNIDYDVICKIDADLIFPEDYFFRLEEMFRQDEKIGIAGGVCAIEVDGQWVRESVSKDTHLRGALKAYRKACYEAIGGLQPVMGWDTIDQLKAKYLGWEVKVDPTLLVKHLRPTNKETGWRKISLVNGRILYQHRYGPVIGIYSCLKRGWKHQPYVLSGLLALYGYLQAWVLRLPFHFTKAEASAIRKEIWRRKF